MIHLSNGHSMCVVAAAGAMGFDGRDAGHGFARLWKLPFRLFGCLRTRDITVITKTITWEPRLGNYRWWKPWQSIRFLGEGNMINAMALTNPGIHSWKRNWYDGIVRRGYPVILSIALDDADQAVEFGRYVNRLDDLAGIELNVSCPSTEHRFAASDQICEIVSSFCRWCQIPTGIKLGYTDPYIDIATRTDGLMAWFDIINTVPWDSWFDAHWSRDCDRDVPIPSGDWWLDYRKYGVNSPVVRSTGKSGGISGPAIRYMAQSTLEKLRKATKAPIISGGGLFTKQDVLLRFNLGANAVALGTVCLHRPWRVNSMVRLAIQADVACAGNLHHQRRLS